MVNLHRIFSEIIRRDIRLAWAQGGTGTMALSFFLMAVTLFPFGVGPEPQILARIGAGIIWVVALLAALISLDRIFQADYEDGSLDHLMLSPLPLWAVVLAKVIAHWAATIVPLVLASPFLGFLLNLNTEATGILTLSLLIGSPAFSLIGAIGAGLTVALRRGGVLLSLLVLPLYIPTLIFGVGAVDAMSGFQNPAPHLALLAATSLFALLIAPFATAAALKIALE